jgi:hypothetical protein
MRLSELAKKKNLTATEASRRLQRMNEARLIQRDFEGFFSIAGYGRARPELLRSLFALTSPVERLIRGSSP